MEVEGGVEFHSHYLQRSDVPASCAHCLRQVRPCYDFAAFEPDRVVQVTCLERTGRGPPPLLVFTETETQN